MAGQKFQYDESGSTFFYFILSFLALILIPATIYFWPKKKTEGKQRNVQSNSKCLRNKFTLPRLMTHQFDCATWFQIQTKAKTTVSARAVARSA